MRQHTRETVFLFQLESGGWLRYTGGDWGPSMLPTDNILRAACFSSPEEAQSCSSGGWGGHAVKAARVVAMEIV